MLLNRMLMTDAEYYARQFSRAAWKGERKKQSVHCTFASGGT